MRSGSNDSGEMLRLATTVASIWASVLGSDT